jgi:hypothetical protein
MRRHGGYSTLRAGSGCPGLFLSSNSSRLNEHGEAPLACAQRVSAGQLRVTRSCLVLGGAFRGVVKLPLQWQVSLEWSPEKVSCLVHGYSVSSLRWKAMGL